MQCLGLAALFLCLGLQPFPKLWFPNDLLSFTGPEHKSCTFMFLIQHVECGSSTVDASLKNFLPPGAPCVATLWEGWLASSKLVLFLLSERNQKKWGVSLWEAVPTLTVISSAIIVPWHRGIHGQTYCFSCFSANRISWFLKLALLPSDMVKSHGHQS